MEYGNYGDLSISGSGSTGGGVFHKVSISGTGNIKGDIECESFHVSGSARAVGKISTKTMKISGSTHIVGDTDCAEELTVSGSANLGGNVKCGKIHVMGSANLGGGLTAERVQAEGSIKVRGDCNAEEFSSDGCFQVDGLLNAGTIDLHLKPWRSSARDIGGEKIRVSRSLSHIIGSFLKNLITGSGFLLETGTVEGDEISLEGTKAAVVRGGDVRIGPGCEIGLVEYSGTFERTGDAVVKEVKKV